MGGIKGIGLQGDVWLSIADAPLYQYVSLQENTFPSFSMETNTAFTAKLDDAVRFFSTKSGRVLDKYLPTRLGLFFGSVYLHWATTFYSHEIAHTQPSYNRGLRRMGIVDFHDWSAAVPMLGKIYVSVDSESDMRGTLNGLDQQELNSVYYFEKAITNDSFDLDDSFSYIFNNFADLAYHTFLGNWPRGDIQSIKREKQEYLGVNLDTSKWAAISLLSGIASFHSLESLALMFQYLYSGKRIAKPVSLKLGDTKIYPPHISFHMTHDDAFLNGQLPIKFGNKGLAFFHFGSTVYAPFKTWRSGVSAKYSANHSLDLKSEFYLNFNKDSYRGFMAGFKLDWAFEKGWNLSLAAKMHKGDYLYEDIMGYAITRRKPPFEGLMQQKVESPLNFMSQVTLNKKF